MTTIKEMTSVAAYYKWKNNPDSDTLLNWLVAEKEINSKCLVSNDCKLNVEFLCSGAQFVENEEINIEAKHLDKNVKLDEFYNNSIPS